MIQHIVTRTVITGICFSSVLDFSVCAWFVMSNHFGSGKEGAAFFAPNPFIRNQLEVFWDSFNKISWLVNIFICKNYLFCTILFCTQKMFINAVLLFYVCLVCESMKLFMKYVSKQLTNSKIHFFHTKLSYWLYGLEATAEKRDSRQVIQQTTTF